MDFHTYALDFSLSIRDTLARRGVFTRAGEMVYEAGIFDTWQDSCRRYAAEAPRQAARVRQRYERQQKAPALPDALQLCEVATPNQWLPVSESIARARRVLVARQWLRLNSQQLAEQLSDMIGKTVQSTVIGRLQSKGSGSPELLTALAELFRVDENWLCWGSPPVPRLIAPYRAAVEGAHYVLNHVLFHTYQQEVGARFDPESLLQECGLSMIAQVYVENCFGTQYLPVPKGTPKSIKAYLERDAIIAENMVRIQRPTFSLPDEVRFGEMSQRTVLYYLPVLPFAVRACFPNVPWANEPTFEPPSRYERLTQEAKIRAAHEPRYAHERGWHD